MVFFRECRNGALIVLERENHIKSRGTRLAVHQPLMNMHPSLLWVDKPVCHPATWSYSATKNVQPKGLSPNKYHSVRIQLSDFIHHTMGSLDDLLPLTVLGGKKTLSTRLKALLISRAFKPCENYMAIFSSLGILDEAVDETYFAAFLVYWLCEFVLPDSQKIIRPDNLHMAAKLASRDIPALPHINEIPVCNSNQSSKNNIPITVAERIPALEEPEGDSSGDIASFSASIPEKLMFGADPKGIVDMSVPMNSAYTKLEEVGVDPITLKHSVLELMAAAVEYNKTILTQVSLWKMLPSSRRKFFLLLKLKLAKIDLQDAEEALSGEGIIFEKVSNEVQIRHEKLRALPPLSPSF
ncbi:hypothetical protein ACFE04_011323 [Oxalis oulophora]